MWIEQGEAKDKNVIYSWKKKKETEIERIAI